jgi:hypothetical protein
MDIIHETFELHIDTIARWKILLILMLLHRVARCVQRWHGVGHMSRSLAVPVIRFMCRRTRVSIVMKVLLHPDYLKEVRILHNSADRVY